MRVPDDIRDTLGKTEVHRSLGTSDYSEAKKRLVTARLRAQSEFEAARRALGPSTDRAGRNRSADLADSDLYTLMTEWFVEALKADRALTSTEADAAGRLAELHDWADLTDDDTASSVTSITQRYLADRGVEFDPRSEQFLRLTRLMHAAMVEREKRVIQRFVVQPGFALDPEFAGMSASSGPPQSAITFSQLVTRFKQDRMSGWTEKTALKRDAQTRLLDELLGSRTRIDRIDRTQCRAVSNDLARLPSNATKRFKGVSAREVLALPADTLGPPMSPDTANGYLTVLASLFDYAVEEGLLSRSPAKGLSLDRDKVRDDDRRHPFSTAELVKIFNAPLYRGCMDDEDGYAVPGPERPRRARFWVPLICLFSGMRLNEACQLTEDDFQTVGEVDVIHVNEGDLGLKRLKSKAAQRRIPVHPELVAIGLMKYVAERRTADGPGCSLFPDLSMAGTGYLSDNFSKWFARFLEKAGVTRPKVAFHSFRHNFRDALLEAQVPDDLTNILCGWADRSMSGRYGKAPEIIVPLLAREMAKVRYPGLDLGLRQ